MAKKDENGFWLNARGEAVHEGMIRVDEQLRDELVEKIIAAAKNISALIATFKNECNEQIDDYFELLLQNYKVDVKGKSVKGNLNLENFSSTAKVEIRVMDKLKFDEKLQIAKLKIDEYLKEATKDASIEIQTLITKAFEVDKKGNIDSKKIFALKSYDIKNPLWIEAMEIIDESKQVASTKSYIRFYERVDVDSEWKLVPLDIAGV